MVDLPLVRHFDAMPQEQRATWLKGRDTLDTLPLVFRWPDARAIYAIALEAGSVASGARAVEVELMPLPPDKPDQNSAYGVVSAGSRFQTTSPAGNHATAGDKLQRIAPDWSAAGSTPAGAEGWRTQLTLWRKQAEAPASGAVPEKKISLAPDAVAALASFEIVASGTPKGWLDWRKIAKPVPASFTTQKPATPQQWADLLNACRSMRDRTATLTQGDASYDVLLQLLGKLIACSSSSTPDAAWSG